MKFFRGNFFFLFFPLVFHCVLPYPTTDSEKGTLLPTSNAESLEPSKSETIIAKESSSTVSTTNTSSEDFPNESSPNESTPEENRDIEKELMNLLDTAESQQVMEVLPEVLTIEKMKSHDEGRDSGAEQGRSLGQKVAAYLSTHVVHLRLPGVAGNVEEGRGRLKRLLIPFVLLLKLVAATLIPVFMSGIALVALKGMWNGSMAALVAAAIGLRELLLSSHWGAPPHPRVTVLRPHIPIDHVYHGAPYHGGDYFHHGWSRNGVSAAAAGTGAAYADPYKGYGPNAAVAPVGSVWDARL